jgi:type VI secretion system secreted protein VgrG
MVQKLLNACAYLIALAPRLPEDGVSSPALIDAIRAFQQRAMSVPDPDGRVDPNGATIRKLLEASGMKLRPAHVQAFINMALPAARIVQRTWHVPVSVLIAQAAHESGWGRFVKGNAYFGIKGSTGTTGGVKFKTTEVVGGKAVNIVDTFRGYENFEEAAEDYGRFLNENPRYKAAFTHQQDPLRFVDEIARAGYATDPEYATKVKRIIQSFGLTEYDR